MMRYYQVVILALNLLFICCKNVNNSTDELHLKSSVLSINSIVTGLDVPWDIEWGPDNKIWFTEQGGAVSKVDPVTGKKTQLLKIKDVFRKRSMGLLGMAIHPQFKKYPYVFLDYTYLKDSTLQSRIIRYTCKGDTLINPLILLDNIPAGNGHNGSRLIISPDGKLLFSTGDATVSDNAQNLHSLNGKILRVNIDGSIPEDNPITGSLIWSWGHRNIQGLVYGKKNMLWSSEHGDATDDEINVISKGLNYGWPNVQGYCDLPEEKAFCKVKNITNPIKAWTPTIAPAGIAYYSYSNIPEWKNCILLTTLKGNSLHVLQLNQEGTSIISDEVYFRHYGRLRDVCVSPAGDIYIATSNRDWNPSKGFPKPEDDRIFRISNLQKKNR